MWMAILLCTVLVLSQSFSALATGETYTGYIMHVTAGNNGDQVTCLVPKPDDETVPVLRKIEGYPDLDNVFLECQLWTITNTTLATGTFDQMLISVEGSSNQEVAKSSNGDPIISPSGTNVLFAFNRQLHGSKLSDFIYHSPETPIDIAFGSDSGRISAFCLTIGADLGDDLFVVKTASFGRGDVCTGGATDWFFIAENQCASNPCKNGGTCRNLDLSRAFECDCTEEFHGDDCSQAKPCARDPCQNGGSCTNLLDTNDFQCDCEAFFCGKTCSNACTLGCLNNSTYWFDACQEKDYRRAEDKRRMLMCKKNKCKAVSMTAVDRCGDKCRPLDCVETAILEQQCKERTSKSSSHGRKWRSKRHSSGHNSHHGSSSSSSSGYSRSKSCKCCTLEADTKSCNGIMQ